MEDNDEGDDKANDEDIDGGNDKDIDDNDDTAVLQIGQNEY